jgi:hypothetical protein
MTLLSNRLVRALLVVCLISFAAESRPPPTWKLTILDTFGGSSSFGNGINDERVAVGSARDAQQAQHGFVWSGGKVTQVPGLPGSTGSVAFAINDLGAICGWSVTSNGDEPTLWIHGVPFDLGAPPAGFPLGRCFVLALDPGLGAGNAFASDFSVSRSIGFRHGETLDISIPDPDLTFNIVTSMNAEGLVSAWASGVTSITLVFHSVGYLVDLNSGKTTTLKPFSGDTETLASLATDGGRIYGFSYNDVTQSVVRFDPRHPGQGTVLRTEPLGFGSVFGNDTFLIETYSGTQNPILFWGGQWIDLTTRIPNLGTFTIGDASVVSECGDIVGVGFTAGGDTRGFVLETTGGCILPDAQ